VLRGRLFGRLDSIGVVNTILAITRRFGGIQAGLTFSLADVPMADDEEHT